MLTLTDKQARQSTVGASECAALLGIDPWKSKFDLFVEKTTEPQPDDYGDGPEIDARELGGHLEGAVLSLYETKRTRSGEPTTVIPNEGNERSTNPLYPLLTATLDAAQIVQEVRAGVEAKTAGGRSYKDEAGNWVDPAEEWAVRVPLNYQVQAQAQMMATGLPFITVPCLVLTTRRIHWYDLFPHAGVQARLAEEIERFWTEHVLTGVPPTPTDYVKAVKALPKLVPERSGAVSLASEKATTLDAYLREMTAEKRAMQARLDDYEQRIKAAQWELAAEMGDAAEATIEATGVKYKATNVRVKERTQTVKSYEYLLMNFTEPKGTIE